MKNPEISPIILCMEWAEYNKGNETGKNEWKDVGRLPSYGKVWYGIAFNLPHPTNQGEIYERKEIE